MKKLFFLTLFLLTVFGGSTLSIPPSIAQETAESPRINLLAENQPLGEILDNISQDTGYQFKLNNQWRDYTVSASIVNLPIEQSLKRLLRNLNHTIIWESDMMVTIKVFGKTEPKRATRSVSPAVAKRNSLRRTRPAPRPTFKPPAEEPEPEPDPDEAEEEKSESDQEEESEEVTPPEENLEESSEESESEKGPQS